jgi:hypothetical protein
MQPLSNTRFKKARLEMMKDNIMDFSPEVGKLVAEVIAQWSEIEFIQGTLLAYILDAEPQTAVAMYLSVNSPQARESLIDSAAHTKLSVSEYNLFAIVTGHAKSVCGHRNRMAHWAWATSRDIPQGTLLLINPQSKIRMQVAITSGPFLLDHRPSPEDIYLVDAEGVKRVIRDIIQARKFLGRLSGCLWKRNSDSKRALFRQQLSSEPAIRVLLDNLKSAHANKSAKSRKRPRAPKRQ